MQGAHINLKGFMVGNAWTDATIDNRGAVDFWFQHGMVSAPTYTGIVSTCNFSDVGPLKSRRGGNDACDSFCDKANKEMGAINIYDVYEDVCESDASLAPRASSDATAGHRLLRLMGRMSPLFAPRSAEPSPPCIDDYTTSWINQEAVYQVLVLAPFVSRRDSSCRPCTWKSRTRGPAAATSSPTPTPTSSPPCCQCKPPPTCALACAPTARASMYARRL